MPGSWKVMTHSFITGGDSAQKMVLNIFVSDTGERHSQNLKHHINFRWFLFQIAVIVVVGVSLNISSFLQKSQRQTIDENSALLLKWQSRQNTGKGGFLEA